MERDISVMLLMQVSNYLNFRALNPDEMFDFKRYTMSQQILNFQKLKMKKVLFHKIIRIDAMDVEV